MVSDNFTVTISDHLPQFFTIRNILSTISGNKSNIYEKNWSKFHRENFILDYFSADWEDFLKIDEFNAYKPPKIDLDKISVLLYEKLCGLFMATLWLEPLRGGSLLLTTKFPEIPGTHFIDLRRIKG